MGALACKLHTRSSLVIHSKLTVKQSHDWRLARDCDACQLSLVPIVAIVTSRHIPVSHRHLIDAATLCQTDWPIKRPTPTIRFSMQHTLIRIRRENKTGASCKGWEFLCLSFPPSLVFLPASCLVCNPDLTSHDSYGERMQMGSACLIQGFNKSFSSSDNHNKYLKCRHLHRGKQWCFSIGRGGRGHQRLKVAAAWYGGFDFQDSPIGVDGGNNENGLKWPASGSLSRRTCLSKTSSRRVGGVGKDLYWDTQLIFFSGFDSLNNPLTPYFYKWLYDNWLP